MATLARDAIVSPSPAAKYYPPTQIFETSRLPLLVGKDKFFGAPGEGPRYEYPLPRRPEYPISVTTWLQSHMTDTLNGPQPLPPIRTLDRPLQRAPTYTVVGRTWTQNLLETTLAPLPPGVQSQLQRASYPQLALSWSQNLLETTLASAPAPPPGHSNLFQAPARAWVYPLPWPGSSTRLAPPPAAPPLPPGAASLLQPLPSVYPRSRANPSTRLAPAVAVVSQLLPGDLSQVPLPPSLERARIAGVFVTQNLLETTLGQIVQRPFNQYAWPAPRPAAAQSSIVIPPNMLPLGAVPVPVPVVVPPPAGGGYPKRRKKRKHAAPDWQRKDDREAKLIAEVKAIYARFVEGAQPTAKATAVAKAIAPFVDNAVATKALPPPAQIDFPAMVRRIDGLSATLAALGEHRMRQRVEAQAIEDDDMDVIDALLKSGLI